jgi:hypothetical protein
MHFRKTIRLAMAALLAFCGFALVGPAQAASHIDVTSNIEYSLDPCASATDLDCIQSVGFIDDAGTYLEAKYEGMQGSQVRIDQWGNTINEGESIWKTGALTANLRASLDSPEVVIFKNADDTPHHGSALRLDFGASNLLALHVRVAVRTSFLRPSNIQLVADNANFSQTSIAGGNLWTFEGQGTAVSNYTHDFQVPDRQTFAAQADEDTSTLHFFIHHADPNLAEGYFPGVCADVGYTVQAFNSNSAGDPSIAPDGSMQFAIFSPHTKADGSGNHGFFKFWTTDKFLDCKFPGNKLTKAAGLTVSVVDENGTTQVSTNQVSHKDGKVFVSATNFHYSSPSIKVAPIAAVPVAAKKITIKCANTKNKKLIKSVTALKPVCPKGYKKVG